MEEKAVFRGVSLETLVSYLEDLGGRSRKGLVVGDGWEAHLETRDVSLHSLVVPETVITMRGERAAIDLILSKLRKMAMRAGG